MKKIFGGLNITWKVIVISAIIIGVSVGLLNSVPALKDTSITDFATYFDIWILFGVLIIMNSKSNKDSALKCFMFFLISQPLIYLVEVPFSHLGWGLFGYYKYWFMWTVFCLPMGYIGYYLKKNKWWGLIILLPMMLLLGYGVYTNTGNLVYAFPKHIASYLYCVSALIIFPLYILGDKKAKVIGLIIGILLVLVPTYLRLTNKRVYSTEVLCSGGEYTFDDTYTVTLKNDNSEIYIEKIDDEIYCVHGVFYKEIDTELILEKDEDKQVYKLEVLDNTYNIEKIK